MWFSAIISFVAGVILSLMGGVLISKVQSRSQLIFVCIPLVLSFQQTAEGFLWLSIQNPSYASVRSSATYTVVFFAQLVWPLLVSTSLFLLEKEERLKKILRLFPVAGVLAVLFQSYCILIYPVRATIVSHHISYELHHHGIFNHYSEFCFAVATLVPPFFSSVKRMWLLGIVLIITVFCEDYFVSIWCFFASLISITVYAIAWSMNKMEITPVDLN